MAMTIHRSSLPVPFGPISRNSSPAPSEIKSITISKKRRGLPLEDIGYLVDNETGDEWDHKATAFRDDKDKSSAYFHTDDLPKFLDRVYASIMLSHRRVLLDTHVGGTVYNTEDLTDFSTEQKTRAAAELWVSLLARAGALADIDDVIDFLQYEKTVPCNLRPRIYNLDEVRTALNGTDWEHTVYCPDEWDTLQRSRRSPLKTKNR